MKKNNKIIALLSALMALMICVGAFAACDIPGENETNAGTGTGSDTETSTDANDTNVIKNSEYIEVDSLKYDSISVTIPTKYKVDDAAVAAHIQSLCEAYATVTGKITDRAIVNGDTVYLYYEGILDGVAFEGGSNMSDVQPAELVIGSGTFIPGFEEALIGIIPNQTSKEKTVPLNLTFPKDYHSADLAGKSVVFNVYVEYIAEFTPAEYNEDFVTKTVGFKTEEKDVIAAFNKYIEEYLGSQRDDQIRNAIWEQLLERIKVKKYPDGEYDRYYKSFVEQIDNNYDVYVKNKDYYAKYYGMNFNSKDEFAIYYFGLSAGDDWKAHIEKESNTCVKQDLIYQTISEWENMKVTSAEYKEAIEYYIDLYGANYGYTYTEEQIEANLGSDYLKKHVIFEKVSDLLFANTTVTYAD